jgi:Ca-activated chloride channel homolog
VHRQNHTICLSSLWECLCVLLVRNSRLTLATWAALLTLAATTAIAQTVTPDAAQTATAPTALIIFDGSGSMWGKLDGERQTKLVQARDALRKSLGAVKPNQRLGLASFGHRRGGDCSDAVVITQPENATPEHIAEQLMAPLEKLNPKGKGPLTTAMKEAAKSLAKTSGPRSLILIHDDLDNCQQEACAAVSDIQGFAPGVMIHVVGLGLREGDATKYQCLTKPTGGRHINAQNGEQISAGIDDVMRAAMLDQARDLANELANDLARGTVRPAGAAAALKVPEPKAVDLAIDGPPALRLKAMLAPGVPVPATRQIRWTVQAEAKPNASAARLLGTELLSLQEPGVYRVIAEDGLVRNESTVTVKARGHTLLEAVFNAGLLRLRPPLDAREVVTVFYDEQTTPVPATGTGSAAVSVPPRAIGIVRDAGAEIVVPSGQLLLRRTLNRRISERKIAIKAGTAADLDFGAALGLVQVHIAPPLASDGKDPRSKMPTIIAIEEDDPDQSRGRRQIAQSAATVAEFAVSPGTYTLVASKGTLEYRERIAVNSGETVKRILPLANARIILTSRITSEASGAAIPAPAIWYRIERLDSPATEALSTFELNPIVDVPAGRYRITANATGFNAQVTTDVDVTLGESRAVILQLPLALVRMTASPALKADGDLAWRLETATQERIWADGIGTAPVWLAAGTYIIKAEGKTTTAAVRVELKPGESRAITVGN